MAREDNSGNNTDPFLQNLISTSINPPPTLFSLPEHNTVDVAIPTHHGVNRTRSAPAMAAINDVTHPVDRVFHRPKSYSKSRQVVALLIVYVSVMSVATVLYGDQALKTLPGWLLAAIWLLVSTLAVALVFSYLAKARVDKRNRERAKRVLAANMSLSQFFAADIDNNGYVSKSEYLIYKLKEMDKISQEDIIMIANHFDKLDGTNSGRITLSDLL